MQDDPKKLIEMLKESEVFGESIDRDRQSMQSYIEGLFKAAQVLRFAFKLMNHVVKMMNSAFKYDELNAKGRYQYPDQRG